MKLFSTLAVTATLITAGLAAHRGGGGSGSNRGPGGFNPGGPQSSFVTSVTGSPQAPGGEPTGTSSVPPANTPPANTPPGNNSPSSTYNSEVPTSSPSGGNPGGNPNVPGGTAAVFNHCNFPVYLKSVDTVTPGRGDDQTPLTLSPNTGSYSEQYRRLSSGGVSIKLSRDHNNWDLLLQFEYTLTDLIYYDASNVNCDCRGGTCPFYNEGFMIQNSSPTCDSTSSKPQTCNPTDAYNVWNDDIATKGCNAESSITLHLCQS